MDPQSCNFIHIFFNLGLVWRCPLHVVFFGISYRWIYRSKQWQGTMNSKVGTNTAQTYDKIRITWNWDRCKNCPCGSTICFSHSYPVTLFKPCLPVIYEPNKTALFQQLTHLTALRKRTPTSLSLLWFPRNTRWVSRRRHSAAVFRPKTFSSKASERRRKNSTSRRLR